MFAFARLLTLCVKSAKRLIRDNTGSKRRLDTDRFAGALLEHRNTPDPDTDLSPAQVIYGRQIRDFQRDDIWSLL